MLQPPQNVGYPKSWDRTPLVGLKLRLCPSHSRVNFQRPERWSPWIRSIGVNRELEGNAESQAPVRLPESTAIFKNSPDDSHHIRCGPAHYLACAMPKN